MPTKTTTPATPATTRTRAASPFVPTTRITIAVHGSADGAATDPSSVGKVLAAAFPNYAVRTVSRTRKGSKGTGPASLMVYIAPTGYEFPKSGERGVRLDAETANLLRAVAVSMGLDPNDSASILAVAKALAAKASAK